MPLYDLHSHTNFSDGKLSPQELIALAEQNNVTHLAITDHDTVAAHRYLSEHCSPSIQLISGIELSCQWQGACIHVVGLNIDINRPAILAAEAIQAKARTERLQMIASKLHKLGFENIVQGSQAVAGKAQVCRPHIATFMVQEKMVKTSADAFKKYLGNGKVGDVSCVWPELMTVVDWIKSANGIAVLAHPQRYKMTASKRNRLIKHFVDVGGEALEVCTANQTPMMVDTLAKQCEKLGLFASVGSDFHGHHQWVNLGRYPVLPRYCRPVWQAWA